LAAETDVSIAAGARQLALGGRYRPGLIALASQTSSQAPQSVQFSPICSRPVIPHFDRADRARLDAIGDPFACFLIDAVHRPSSPSAIFVSRRKFSGKRPVNP